MEQNRYLKFIRDVVAKTKAEKLTWTHVSNRDELFSTLKLRNYRTAYTAEYLLGATEYKLYFVSADFVFEDDFGAEHDEVEHTLFVVDLQGNLIMAVDRSVVGWPELSELYSCVIAYNVETKNFFLAFDELKSA